MTTAEFQEEKSVSLTPMVAHWVREGPIARARSLGFLCLRYQPFTISS